mgnify:CR=1 FL=1
MYNHADKQEDKEKSYIELDSTETEIIKYLNDNYKDVILLVKSSAAMELDWLKQYPNIKAVVYSQNVTNALAKVFSGEVNPSGRTVDTFAADALASPAAQNFGSYQYYDENGKATKYNYVDYAEGIYVATSITRPVTRTRSSVRATRAITITPRKSCTRSGTD